MAKLKTKTVRKPTASLAAHREGLITWLLEEARFYPRTREVIEQLCQRLVAAGVPLMRVVVNVRTVHPQIFATNYRWERGGKAVIFDPGHDIVNDPEYLNSPFKMIHDGAGGIRRRLEDAEVEMDFPVLKTLKAEGATDYLVAPIVFGDGVVKLPGLGIGGSEGVSDCRGVNQTYRLLRQAHGCHAVPFVGVTGGRQLPGLVVQRRNLVLEGVGIVGFE